MKAPRLRKNESISSFRARVAMWQRKTGKQYPQSGWGTREERALSNRVKLGTFGKFIDYSTNYEDEIKEYSLENLKIPTKESLDEQAIADLTSGKVDPYTMNLPDKNRLVKEKIDKQYKNTAVLDHIKKINNNQTVPEGMTPNSKISERIPIPGSENAVKEGGNVKETSNREQLKSDVFTIHPETLKAVGVLTKAQRKAFDKRYQEDLQKNRNKLRTYTIKGKPVKRYG
jgi:hypothetical protein